MTNEQPRRRFISTRLAILACAAISLCGFVLVASLIFSQLGRGSIHNAIRRGDLKEVVVLLDAVPARLEVRDNIGSTPLLAAAYYGQADIADLLVKRHANINAVWSLPGASKGLNALHIAAINGHVKVARRLIDAGVPINGRSKDRRTPLDIALMNRHAELAALYRKHGGKSSRP